MNEKGSVGNILRRPEFLWSSVQQPSDEIVLCIDNISVR